MKNYTTLILLFILLLIGVAAYLYYSANNHDESSLSPDTPEQQTDENENSAEQSWSTISTDEYSFRYPTELMTEYVSLTDWPPQVQIIEEAFSCSEGGEQTARAGETESINIQGGDYCRTTVSEGAAGSIYSQYAYAFAHEDKTVILTFTTRATQCSNYPEAEKVKCETERENLDIDELVNRITDTFILID